MLLTMIVSLYTSRIILHTLGESDYGIYNVVAGIVTIFAVLSSTMANSAQRFLSIDIGSSELNHKLQNTFNQFVLLHVFVAVIVLILAETIGIWFFLDKLNIPVERKDAANVVYQLSVILFVLNIIKAPYEAGLIAKENMKIYAYIGVFEVFAKLGSVFLLVTITFDKLIIYAVLFSIVSISTIVYTIVYVIKKYADYQFVFSWDSSRVTTILKFVGWNYLTAIGDVSRMQGINILLNLFFGPAVNAARGIAFQVQASIIRFVTGFQTSVNPQLVKNWSANDKEGMIILMSRTSKLSFFMLLIISAPVILNCEYILKLWLNNPPDFTVEFCNLVLLQALIESVCYPMWTVVGAIGKLRFSHLLGSILYGMMVVFSYMALKSGAEPTTVFIISIILMIVVMFMLIFRINYLVPGFLKIEIKQIVIKPLFVLLPFLLFYFIPIFDVTNNIVNLIKNSVIIIFTFLFVIYFIGLDKIEKSIILNVVKKKMSFL